MGENQKQKRVNQLQKLSARLEGLVLGMGPYGVYGGGGDGGEGFLI